MNRNFGRAAIWCMVASVFLVGIDAFRAVSLGAQPAYAAGARTGAVVGFSAKWLRGDVEATTSKVSRAQRHFGTKSQFRDLGRYGSKIDW
jgi:hypothetical protein